MARNRLNLASRCNREVAPLVVGALSGCLLLALIAFVSVGCGEESCKPAICPKGSCGPYPDGCGGTIDCMGCQTGYRCQEGVCVPTGSLGESCEDTTCQEPPAPYCEDNTLVTFVETGTCEDTEDGPVCDYPRSLEPCGEDYLCIEDDGAAYCERESPPACDINDVLNDGADPYRAWSELENGVLRHTLWGTDGHSSDDLYVLWALDNEEMPEDGSTYLLDPSANVEDCTVCVLIQRIDADWNTQLFFGVEGFVEITRISEGVFEGEIRDLVLEEWDGELDAPVEGSQTWCLPDYSWSTPLEIVDSEGCDTWEEPVFANPNCGPAPLTVAFDGDLLEEALGDAQMTEISWDFGNGNGSYAQNPVHTYHTVGDYTVTARISTQDGVLTITYVLEEFVRVHE